MIDAKKILIGAIVWFMGIFGLLLYLFMLSQTADTIRELFEPIQFLVLFAIVPYVIVMAVLSVYYFFAGVIPIFTVSEQGGLE